MVYCVILESGLFMARLVFTVCVAMCRPVFLVVTDQIRMSGRNETGVLKDL